MSVEREFSNFHPLGATEDFSNFPQRYVLGLDAGDITSFEYQPGSVIWQSASVSELPEYRCPEWDSGPIPVTLSDMQEALEMFGAPEMSMARQYALNLILDRDNRFNEEEQAVYDETLLDLEYGPGFRLRAHP